MNRIIVIFAIAVVALVITGCKEKKLEIPTQEKDAAAAVLPTTEVKPVVIVPDTKPEPKPAK